jgi:peptide chain release factor 1
MSVVPEEKLDALVNRFAAIEGQLATVAGGGEEFVRLSREYAELAPVVKVVEEYRAVQRELDGLKQLLEDAVTDPEMQALAESEREDNKGRLEDLDRQLRLHLLPRDQADERNAIIEIRAGTGGEEAGLFAAELFRMYQRYAEGRGWKFEPLDYSEKEHGGIKEAQALVSGRGVFARLKFESGVHRVQRVPETESSGRIHTSAATVAVLPEAEEVDVHVDEKDLRVDVYRASGPGGQSVNTTDSAVRLTHMPTGIVVTQQDEKSQHKNRAKAMKILFARIYDREREEADRERAAARKVQVGTGDRSERVRTYNFPQGRVTDHRINLTLHKLTQVLEGEALEEIVDALISEDQASRLADLDG